jgi:hypothetical protein
VTGPDGMSSLLRLTELAEKLGGLDSREGEHFEHLTGQLGKLAETVRDAGTRLDRHGEIISALDGLDQQVIELARHVAALSEEPGGEDDDEDGKGPYRPAKSIRWWALEGDARAEPLGRLAAWVRDIYVPGYGHLAAVLPPCWRQHDLILYALDTLAELWMLLYLSPQRTASTLAGQAEFQTRVLPLYVEQMRAEVRDCRHATALNGALR